MSRASRFVVPMEGKTSGHLTVLRRAGSIVRRFNGAKVAAWLCRCTCGAEVVVSGQKLRRGETKACGVNGHHWSQQPRGGVFKNHESEYGAWNSMWKRCTDPENKNYKNYGGRGITVSERWKSFRMFLSDVGAKPHPDLTLDRKNTNGNYEPGNCRWVSRTVQNRNTRRSVYVTYEGKRQLLVEVVAKLGLSRNVVGVRLRLGWSLEDAISIPVKRYKNSK